MSLLKQCNYDYDLNELIYFIRRLVQINDERMTKLNVGNFPELGLLAKKVKEKLKEDQKHPLIGSYAWCFWKLNYKNDEELWRLLGEYILNDNYHQILKEATFAVEGFTMLMQITDQAHVDKIYQRLERIIDITLWEVNMLYYKRIAESLVKVNRFTPYLFKKLEFHILNNLSMDYELPTMLDIVWAFAIADQGSKEFYNSMQFVICRGHMWNTLPVFRDMWRLTPQQGQFVAKLISTFSVAKQRIPDLRMEPEFLSLIEKIATNDKAQYNLEDLATVMEHIGTFKFEESGKINGILDKRLFEVDENMYAEDMIRFIDIKARRDYEGDCTKLPKKFVEFFDAAILKSKDLQGPERVYQYLFESEMRGLVTGKEELIEWLIVDMQNKIQQYDFEKVCYMYWLVGNYRHLLTDKTNKLQPALNFFKDYIKLYRTLGSDQRTLSSHYYRLLEIVNESDLSFKDEQKRLASS